MITNIPLVDYGITLQEIPDKVALYFELGECNWKCKGCHSEHLLRPLKQLATADYIIDIYNKYSDDVNAVVFMGGNNNGKMSFDEFIEEVVKPISKRTDVCIYMGDWDVFSFTTAAKYCKWIKVGSYKESLGGLNSDTTNQVFVEVQNGKFKNK